MALAARKRGVGAVILMPTSTPKVVTTGTETIDAQPETIAATRIRATGRAAGVVATAAAQ